MSVPGSSSATPSPTISSVEARIAAINTQAEKLTEAYDAARVQLTAIQGKAKAAGATLAKDQHTLAGMQQRISAIATAAYESGGMGNATALLQSGNPETVANRTSELAAVAQTRQTELAKALAADRAVRADQATYQAQLTAEKRSLATITSKRNQIQSLLSKQQQLLASLKAAQRRRIEAQQAAARRAALAARSTYHAPAAPAATHHTSYSGPATGSAAAAVRFAYAQLGKPYVYGAAGPSSYDCSGLTMAAWGAAGVSLPHNAAMQQSSIPSVSLSALQPGDLVFFGSPAYHVAIYIGGGRIIQAPHTGAYVEITPLSYMPSPSGAGRP